jgi:hypothetical protein
METWTLKRKPDWMHVADPRILVALAASDEPPTVRGLHRTQPYPRLYIHQRCERMASEGLVQPLPERKYELRELGRAFLKGEVPISDLESHPMGGAHLTA